MAAPLVGMKLLLTYRGLLNGQTVLNTFWYRLVVLGTELTVKDLLDNTNDKLNLPFGFRDTYASCLPSNHTIVESWLQVIKPVRLVRQSYTDGNTGDLLEAFSSNVQASITRRGELATKSAIGAVHIPIGGADDQYQVGILTNSALKTNLTSFADKMLDDIEVPDVGGAIWRPIVFNPTNTTYPNGHDVISTGVQSTVRVMRRRTVGLGI